MRVLVVDQDSTLLTEITRLLGEYFTIVAVTTKGDCLDLVRSNEFEVIVAGERLEDGSGLELLGQLARSRPDMLRIFAAERERLRLLKGRLGPFGLFRTLTYPIQPRQLLAALSAAAGVDVQIEAYQRRRDLAVDMLNAARGISCHKPEGAFYVFPNVAGCLGKTTTGGRKLNTDEDVCLALMEENYVATVHGAAYFMSPFLRISTATADDELLEGLKRIQTFCEGLSE
jgi:CheY-like chemotaxis protein